MEGVPRVYEGESENAKRRRYLRRRQMYDRARRVHSGGYVFALLARSAIRLAVNSEPNPDTRTRRRSMLIRRWKKYMEELGFWAPFGIPMPR